MVDSIFFPLYSQKRTVIVLIYIISLGEAPVWRHAAAQKCPKTPMGEQKSSS